MTKRLRLRVAVGWLRLAIPLASVQLVKDHTRMVTEIVARG